MPRLTSKMTVKIEPELLQRIQEISESRNISVSYYVREALIKYQREADEEKNNISMRVRLTPMESFVLGELKRLGVLVDSEDLFHRSFDSYYRNEIDRLLEIGDRLTRSKGFSSEQPKTIRTAEPDIEDEPVENENLEGDTNK